MAFRSVPRPSSPPGAKASTECPSHTRSPCPRDQPEDLPRISSGATMHRNHPQTQLAPPGLRCQRHRPGRHSLPDMILRDHSLRTSQDCFEPRLTAIADALVAPPDPINRSHNASELSPPMTGAAIPQGDALPGQTGHRTTGHSPGRSTPRRCPLTPADRAASRAWHTRPETHQNLIHTDKDQPHGARTRPGHCAQACAATELERSAIPTRLRYPQGLWRRPGSNR